MPEMFISAVDERCRNAFVKALEPPGTPPRIRDLYDRYKIWAANVGASHTGPSYKRSLDYRLRKAPAYSEQVIATLTQVEQYLNQITLYLTGDADDVASSNSSSQEGDLDSDGALSTELNPMTVGKWTLSDSEDDAASQHAANNVSAARMAVSGLEWLSDRSGTQLEPTLASIDFAIAALYKLPVREATAVDRLKRYAHSDQGDFDMYTHFDRLYVRDLFRNVDHRIVTRLARLVTERRRLLKYRKLYNEELEQEQVDSQQNRLSRSQLGVTPSQAQTFRLGRDDSGSEYQPATLARSSLRASTFKPKDALLKPDQFLSSGASEVDDVSSIALTAVEQDRIAIPLRPRGTDGKELQDFVCPLCNVIRSVKSTRAWK